MITNHLLEEKDRIQRKLAQEAQYDVFRYMENTRRIVLEAQEKYRLKLKYVNLQGGTLKPTCRAIFGINE